MFLVVKLNYLMLSVLWEGDNILYLYENGTFNYQPQEMIVQGILGNYTIDNDTIILEKVITCESGDDCVVMVNGNDGTFKRVFKNENGIILQPLNNNYQPIIYTNEQIDALPVRILGKVVELRRKK